MNTPCDTETAQNILDLANEQLGTWADARGRLMLKTIIKDFPDTPAAEEARQLLLMRDGAT